MTQRTVETPFMQQLGEVLDAEHNLLAAQQELLAQVQDGRLQALLEQHSRETEQHIARLEQAGALLGQPITRHSTAQTMAFVQDAREALQQAVPGAAAGDRGIAAAALGAEEWEIARYRPLVSAAEEMGNAEVRHLLHINLQEEEQTAHMLREQLLQLSGTEEDSDTLRSEPL